MKEYVAANPEDLMTMNILGEASQAMKESVKAMMTMCDSVEKL